MADIKWNGQSVNFNDVNSGMNNAIQGYSNAGNIFGNLRKSILDEEQRAKDNEFRQKQMDENIRQFDLRLGFDAVKHKDEMADKDRNFEQRQYEFDMNYEQKDRHHKDEMGLRAAQLRASQEANKISLGMKELQAQRLALEQHTTGMVNDVNAFGKLDDKGRQDLIEKYTKLAETDKNAAAVLTQFKSWTPDIESNPMQQAKWVLGTRRVAGDLTAQAQEIKLNLEDAAKGLEIAREDNEKNITRINKFNEATKDINKEQRTGIWSTAERMNTSLQSKDKTQRIDPTLVAQYLKQELGTVNNWWWFTDGDKSIGKDWGSPQSTQVGNMDSKVEQALLNGLTTGAFGARISSNDAKAIMQDLKLQRQQMQKTEENRKSNAPKLPQTFLDPTKKDLL